MKDFLRNFADVAADLDQTIPPFQNNGNIYKPGIGPYAEDQIVGRVVNEMKRRDLLQDVYLLPAAELKREIGLNNYLGLNGRAATPDLVTGGNIIEFKICRPLRDNGEREDTWFKKVFEPNPQAYSTFLDVIKLCRFRDNHDKHDKWGKWVVVIGFERKNEKDYVLDTFFPDLFKFISAEIVNLPYAEFLSETRDLEGRHPYHQVLKLYAFRY